ncbi:50S ribosome-binding GTPase [Candidatus Saccharibacteria bacterium]|nr:50S ribosome-binding GTPase [Candidatus Saccharibacteria bacterium]
MKSLPIVALIGQTNAGKSSLLNRLAHKNIAIVAREEGTTRDSVSARIDNRFLLVDTAGLKDPEDDFEATIQDQIADAIDSAEVILLTLDSTKYPDDKDKQIAKSALKSKKPVILVLNKSDKGESLPDEEFLRLGIKPDMTIRTSATTGQGTRDLAEKVQDIIGNNIYKEKDTSLKVALIGRPNVGKSSLFNSLAKKQQAIVSSRQGTTRDVNRVTIKFKGRDIEFLDTAGLRKPGKREVGIEKFSALRTLAAIEEADICALLIDATEPHSKLDQSLAGQIVDAGKGIIVILTKSDLINERNDQALPSETVPRISYEKSDASDTRNGGLARAGLRRQTPVVSSTTDEILDKLEYDFNFIPYAPVLITSSETGKNVTKLYDLIETVDKSRHTEIPTSKLNHILRDAVVSHPPAGLKNTHPKPKYIVQTDTCPPWFVIHGREMQMMHWSYKRFLERKIREEYPLVGTPIMFSFHNETKQEKQGHKKSEA